MMMIVNATVEGDARKVTLPMPYFCFAQRVQQDVKGSSFSYIARGHPKKHADGIFPPNLWSSLVSPILSPTSESADQPILDNTSVADNRKDYPSSSSQNDASGTIRQQIVFIRHQIRKDILDETDAESLNLKLMRWEKEVEDITSRANSRERTMLPSIPLSDDEWDRYKRNDQMTWTEKSDTSLQAALTRYDEEANNSNQPIALTNRFYDLPIEDSPPHQKTRARARARARALQAILDVCTDNIDRGVDKDVGRDACNAADEDLGASGGADAGNACASEDGTSEDEYPAPHVPVGKTTCMRRMLTSVKTTVWNLMTLASFDFAKVLVPIAPPEKVRRPSRAMRSAILFFVALTTIYSLNCLLREGSTCAAVTMMGTAMHLAIPARTVRLGCEIRSASERNVA